LNVPNVRLLDGSESFDQYLPVTISNLARHEGLVRLNKHSLVPTPVVRGETGQYSFDFGCGNRRPAITQRMNAERQKEVAVPNFNITFRCV
jgi:hypothetical protein